MCFKNIDKNSESPENLRPLAELSLCDAIKEVFPDFDAQERIGSKKA